MIRRCEGKAKKMIERRATRAIKKCVSLEGKGSDSRTGKSSLTREGGGTTWPRKGVERIIEKDTAASFFLFEPIKKSLTERDTKGRLAKRRKWARGRTANV